MEAVKFKTLAETQAFWKKRVHEWWASGLRQKEFCERAGLNLRTFRHHSGKYHRRRHEAVSLRLVEVPLQRSTAAVVDAEPAACVPASPNVAPASPLKLRVDDFTLELDAHTDLELLTRVLDLLEHR